MSQLCYITSLINLPLVRILSSKGTLVIGNSGNLSVLISFVFSTMLEICAIKLSLSGFFSSNSIPLAIKGISFRRFYSFISFRSSTKRLTLYLKSSCFNDYYYYFKELFIGYTKLYNIVYKLVASKS